MRKLFLNKKVLLVIGFIIASLIIIILAILDTLSPSTTNNVVPTSPTPTKARSSSVAKPIPYVPTGAAIYYYNQKKDYVIYDPKYATLDEVKEMIKHPDD